MAETIHHPFSALDRICVGDTFEEVRDAIRLPESKQLIAEWVHVFRGAEYAYRMINERHAASVAEQVQDWLASEISK